MCVCVFRPFQFCSFIVVQAFIKWISELMYDVYVRQLLLSVWMMFFRQSNSSSRNNNNKKVVTRTQLCMYKYNDTMAFYVKTKSEHHFPFNQRFIYTVENSTKRQFHENLFGWMGVQLYVYSDCEYIQWINGFNHRLKTSSLREQ